MDELFDPIAAEENPAQFVDLQIWPTGDDAAEIEEELLAESLHFSDGETPRVM